MNYLLHSCFCGYLVILSTLESGHGSGYNQLELKISLFIEPKPRTECDVTQPEMQREKISIFYSN